MPTPLPSNPPLPTVVRAAYNKCLTLEREAEASRVEALKDCPPHIVSARLLGHLLRLVPVGKPQTHLTEEIVSTNDCAALMRLAAFYLSHFVKAFYHSGGPTPALSDHSSNPAFLNVQQESMASMQERTLDHRTARTRAMRRDNNHCIISGQEDYKQPNGTVVVRVAHIIPESVNTNIQLSGHERSRSANEWSILSVFSCDEAIREELAGNKIHRLENVISMNSFSHQMFDELQLWLKPVEGIPHRYRVCTTKESLRIFPPLPEYVTFCTTTTIPLPNREYLALHALCCEVAWMSGATEYIMDIERKISDTRVVARDGSMADLLTAALSLVSAH